MTYERTKQIHKTPQKPLPKHIVVDDRNWTYRVTRSYLIVREPDGMMTHVVPLPHIIGFDWNGIERLEYKGGWKGIGPRHVRGYIRMHLAMTVSIPIPEVVFLAERPMGSWHYSRRCWMLHEGEYVAVFADRAAGMIGAPITAANLCGVCAGHAAHQQHDEDWFDRQISSIHGATLP